MQSIHNRIYDEIQSVRTTTLKIVLTIFHNMVLKCNSLGNENEELFDLILSRLTDKVSLIRKNVIDYFKDKDIQNLLK
jgi:hypothetical protein